MEFDSPEFKAWFFSTIDEAGAEAERESKSSRSICARDAPLPCLLILLFVVCAFVRACAEFRTLWNK